MSANTWRELAGELTADQIEHVETLERRLAPTVPAAELAELLLDTARQHVEDRLVGSAFAEVPAPAGATVHHWERDSAGGWSRWLFWREMGPGPVGVGVDGRQHADGRVERAVSVSVDGCATLTAEAARQLAAELIAAADLLDSLPAPPH